MTTTMGARGSALRTHPPPMLYRVVDECEWSLLR